MLLFLAQCSILVIYSQEAKENPFLDTSETDSETAPENNEEEANPVVEDEMLALLVMFNNVSFI
jgi:hypothetical protein